MPIANGIKSAVSRNKYLYSKIQILPLQIIKILSITI